VVIQHRQSVDVVGTISPASTNQVGGLLSISRGNLPYWAGFVSVDARNTSDLGEVGAGKAGGDHVGPRPRRSSQRSPTISASNR
jgi:hypothetical protein